MSVSAHIAAQRTDHGVPHAVSCRALGVAASTFYKWHNRPPTPAQRRRAELDVEVKACFDASDGTYGSPRVRAALRAVGPRGVQEDGGVLHGPPGPARTRPPPSQGPDPPRQAGRAGAGPAAAGLHRRRRQREVGRRLQTGRTPARGQCSSPPSRTCSPGACWASRSPNRHPTAELATDAINMAAAVRGGTVAGVIFHTDKGSQYTSDAFAAACAKLKITQSMGRVGCALDNAAAESFFSTLQHELISRRRWHTRDQARRDIAVWIDTWYNRKRLHSTNNMTSPIDYELANAA